MKHFFLKYFHSKKNLYQSKVKLLYYSYEIVVRKCLIPTKAHICDKNTQNWVGDNNPKLGWKN